MPYREGRDPQGGEGLRRSPGAGHTHYRNTRTHRQRRAPHRPLCPALQMKRFIYTKSL